MKKSLYILLLSFFVVASAFSSCVSDKDIDNPIPPVLGEMAELSLLADMPSAAELSTRSAGTVTENYIENIYVLVFNKATGDLISKSKGKSLEVVSGSENNNKVTFRATLPLGAEYTFMVLANAPDQLSGIDVGMSKKKSDVMALTTTYSGKWDPSVKAIPMWGEKDMTLTGSSTPSFELTRMLAKVNVSVNLREISPGTQADNFKLTSVRYYNYNTAGTVVPGENNYDFASKAVVKPTIPPSAGTQTGSAIVYQGSEITESVACKEQIYVFEAAHNNNTYNFPANNSDWIENPCLVIGGKYRTEEGVWLEETFYRVDFISKDTTDPNNVKDIWLSVLRNHSYNVTITEVSGSGFPDEETALNSAPINMEANVLEWNDRDMGEIIFDGVFYLSVSRDEVVLERAEVTTEQEEYVLYVKTDYIYKNDESHSNSGWHVEKYVDGTDQTTEVSWLKHNPEKGAPHDRVKAYFTFEENTTSSNRTAVVWIAAGRLRYPVYVTQRVLSLYIVDPEKNDEQITEMNFVVQRDLDIPHTPRKFRVDWTPTDLPVDITWESKQSWLPFAPQYLSPDPDLMSPSWTISGGPGEQTFTVKPPTVTTADINLDPFYEKESIYHFTVTNGGDSETKSIKLNQIYYNIIVDTYSYSLDGKTYTLSVRSNAEWKITKIEEWLYHEDPETHPYPGPVMLHLNPYDNLREGTTGGPNVSGETLAFTVVNQNSDAHKKKWGVVYVTFENPDGKFPPVRAALRFPPEKLLIMGLGYTTVLRGYSIGCPSPFHDNNSYSMLTAPINFGDNDDSKVYVKNMTVVGHFAAGVSSATSNLGVTWTTANLRSWLNENPDILVVSYSMLLNVTESKLIVDYIENGGFAVMLYGGYNDETGAYTVNFLRQLFNDPGLSCSKISFVESDVYKLPDGEEWIGNPILDGPFGSVIGKHWGAHERSVGFKASQANQHIYDEIEIINWSQDNIDRIYLSTGSNPYPAATRDHVMFFRHKTKNVIWIGADCFLSAYPRGNRSGGVNHDPFTLYGDYTPAPQEGFGRVAATYGKEDVYNSRIMANIMAYAISNTKHVPPVGGY